MDICRGRCTLIMDEFYSGYNYSDGCDGTTVSCSSFVKDVNADDGEFSVCCSVSQVKNWAAKMEFFFLKKSSFSTDSPRNSDCPAGG